MSASPQASVILHGVSLAYDGCPAVCRLHGALARGSLTAVVGPNGAGKSTLLKGIVGLLRPCDGWIERRPPDPALVAYLPQRVEIDPRFPISVIETVMLGHWREIGWTRAVSCKLRERARRALAAVGMEEFDRRPIGSLSAGQFQRVLFARLIVQDAQLILLDEPLSAVDWRTAEDLLRLMMVWHKEGRAVAAVLHDLDQVRAYFPETLLMARECIAWGATAQVLTPANLTRAREMSGPWTTEPADRRRIHQAPAVANSA